MRRGDAYTRAARDVADWLDSQGESKRANEVRTVCNSLAGARGALKTLHRDSIDLRDQLRAARTPIARAVATERASEARAEHSALLEPVAAGPAGQAWCDQCQRRVAPEEGRACDRRFCGVAAPRLESEAA